MDKALLFLGAIIIIFGILIFYLMLTSVIKMGQSFKDQYSSLSQVKKNEINISALVSAVIVFIGILVIRKAFKR